MGRAVSIPVAVLAATSTLSLASPATAQQPPQDAPSGPPPLVAPYPPQVAPQPMPPASATMPGAPAAAPPYGPGVYGGAPGSFPQPGAGPGAPGGWPGYGPPYGVPPGPPTLPYDASQPVPSGYRVATRTRSGLILAGGITFGASYVLSVFGAISARTSGRKAGDHAMALYAPVVGPFIAAANQKRNQDGVVGLMIVDGIAQVGGVGLFVTGLFWRQRLLVREPTVARLAPTVVVAPRQVDAIWAF